MCPSMILPWMPKKKSLLLVRLVSTSQSRNLWRIDNISIKDQIVTFSHFRIIWLIWSLYTLKYKFLDPSKKRLILFKIFQKLAGINHHQWLMVLQMHFKTIKIWLKIIIEPLETQIMAIIIQSILYEDQENNTTSSIY